MRSKFIGAAAAAAILASSLGVAMAQTPSPQPAETPEQSTPPAMTSPGPTPDGNNAMMRMQPHTDDAATATPAAAHHKVVSACQKAIQASMKALDKSQASPDTIAQAWQHIETAKQEKGNACKDEAKQAQEML